MCLCEIREKVTKNEENNINKQNKANEFVKVEAAII